LVDQAPATSDDESGGPTDEQREHERAGAINARAEAMRRAGAPLFTAVELKKYIAYVREHFEPTISREVHEIAKEYFVRRRAAQGSGPDGPAAGTTTARMLESLMRLTVAHARLMFRTEANATDVCQAIALIQQSDGGSGGNRKLGIPMPHEDFHRYPDREAARLECRLFGELDLLHMFSEERVIAAEMETDV